jgi:UDP-N-acetylglucosamine 2-epimerase (non-hydrolysing)
VLTDHAADLLLAPTQVAMGHLADEGLAARSVLVGDVMTDVCLRVRDAVLAGGSTGVEGVEDGEYLVATIHRAENTDDPARLRAVVDAMADLPVPVILMAHPRLRARCAEHGVDLGRGAIRAIDPLPYPAMVAAVLGSRGVVTDSGGLQKEAYLLDRACTTLRTETEWTETLDDGWNVLAPDPGTLSEAVMRPVPLAPRGVPYGAGDAAERVVLTLAAAGR